MTLNTWQFYAFSSAFFAGLTAILGKVGVGGINSNLATTIRTIVIFLISVLIVSFRGEWAKTQNLSRHAILFLILSGLTTGFSWLCYYRALQLGPVSKVAGIDKFSVVITILLAFIFLGEAPTIKVILGSSFIFIGVILLTL